MKSLVLGYRCLLSKVRRWTEQEDHQGHPNPIRPYFVCSRSSSLRDQEVWRTCSPRQIPKVLPLNTSVSISIEMKALAFIVFFGLLSPSVGLECWNYEGTNWVPKMGTVCIYQCLGHVVETAGTAWDADYAEFHGYETCNTTKCNHKDVCQIDESASSSHSPGFIIGIIIGLIVAILLFVGCSICCCCPDAFKCCKKHALLKAEDGEGPGGDTAKKNWAFVILEKTHHHQN